MCTVPDSIHIRVCPNNDSVKSVLIGHYPNPILKYTRLPLSMSACKRLVFLFSLYMHVSSTALYGIEWHVFTQITITQS